MHLDLLPLIRNESATAIATTRTSMHPAYKQHRMSLHAVKGTAAIARPNLAFAYAGYDSERMRQMPA